MVTGEVVGALAMTEPVQVRTYGEFEPMLFETAMSGTQRLEDLHHKRYSRRSVCAAITDPGKGAKGTSLFLVDAHAPGFEVEENREIGQHTSDTALLFSLIRLPPMPYWWVNGLAVLDRVVASAPAVAASEGVPDAHHQYVEREYLWPSVNSERG